MNLIKPKHLKKGDLIASISLSWGGAGDDDLLWRYKLGKKRLETHFDLNVIEMEHTLKGSKFIRMNPEKRAKDLMDAFSNNEIKGIFSCIGGDDSIRILPHIDLDIIKNNPKIFLGYSDTTITHLICLKAGLTSFYGPSILAEFAENVDMHYYTKNWIYKTLFTTGNIGDIYPSEEWTSEYLPWIENNKYIKRKMHFNTGYELLQGKGRVSGNLIGGCVESLEIAKNTDIWPGKEIWSDAILFLEASCQMPTPEYLGRCLRSYADMGILDLIKGIIFGKPYSEVYYDEYKNEILKVVKGEKNLDIPILYNLNFGHTAPMFIIPYGSKAEIDCDNVKFKILDSGVI